ncbi:MAG: hypothetical protein IKP00_05625 [Victivallales bacterium]|nr:hypothetical protein [Victivallales bacterium]
MADRINGSVCLNHPNTPAVKRCAVCSKPLCADCVQMHDGVPYCSDLCWDNAKRTGLLVKNVEANKKSVAVKVFIRKVIYLIIIAALVYGGYYYYTHNKSKVDAQLKKAKSTTEQKLQEGKKSIEKGLPGDSKYKRDREKMVNEN